MSAGAAAPIAKRAAMSSRTVLWIGFGSLIVLMLLIALSANRALGRIEAGNSQIRRGFLERDDLLNRIRNQLYRTNIDMRDYLLHADPKLAEQRRAEIQQTYRDMSAAIAQYRKELAPGDNATLDELQRDVEQYFAIIQPVLGWTQEERESKGPAFLRTQMFPRRQQLLQLSERIRQLDTRQLSFGESRVAEVFADFRREIVITAAVLIAFGLGLAFVSIGRVQRLEHESRAQYRQVVQTREELHKLSARLVAAQEDERRKLSRELHDEVGQSMSAMLVELGNLTAAIPATNAPLHDRALRVRKLAEDSVGAIRNMSLLLRPSMLDDLGLTPALKWQARETARRTGMKVRVDADDVADDLPDDYRTCIYRVVQEALHNATRHSRAEHVRVTVKHDAADVRVSIADDGAGFHASDKGMGILGMEERVRNLGGDFEIKSEPGQGTTVSIRLPMGRTRTEMVQ